MGIESFRIDLYWQTNDSKDSIIERLKEFFIVEPHYYFRKKLLFSKKGYAENQYRIQNFIIAYFCDKDNYFCLEACFSNFENYLVLMHEVFCVVQRYFQAKILMNDLIIQGNISFRDFKKIIGDFYFTKMNDFTRKYGSVKKDFLPGNDFYEKIRVSRGRRFDT